MTHEDQNQPMMGPGNEDNDGNEGEGVEPRVESLRASSPSSSPSRTALFSRRDNRSRMVRLALVATALVVLVAVVLGVFVQTTGGIAGGSNPISGVLSSVLHVTPNPTATPTPVIYPTPTLGQETAPALGFAPASCTPPSPEPRTVSVSFTGAIGATPVWIAHFDGLHATQHIGGFGTEHNRYGWETAIVFAVEPSLTDPVVVRGTRLEDRTPLWMVALASGQTYTEATPSVAVVLDPQQSGLASFQNTSIGLGEDWAAWNGAFYIPAAGCYALTATWPGGSWRVTFAAGQ